MNKSIALLLLLTISSVASFSDTNVSSYAKEHHDDDEEETSTNNDDSQSPTPTNPFANTKLEDNGTLPAQIDTVQNMLCKLNIERGFPELNGPQCAPQYQPQ